jgi:hypothetical protein
MIRLLVYISRQHAFNEASWAGSVDPHAQCHAHVHMLAGSGTAGQRIMATNFAGTSHRLPQAGCVDTVPHTSVNLGVAHAWCACL